MDGLSYQRSTTTLTKETTFPSHGEVPPGSHNNVRSAIAGSVHCLLFPSFFGIGGFTILWTLTSLTAGTWNSLALRLNLLPNVTTAGYKCVVQAMHADWLAYLSSHSSCRVCQYASSLFTTPTCRLSETLDLLTRVTPSSPRHAIRRAAQGQSAITRTCKLLTASLMILQGKITPVVDHNTSIFLAKSSLRPLVFINIFANAAIKSNNHACWHECDALPDDTVSRDLVSSTVSRFSRS